MLDGAPPGPRRACERADAEVGAGTDASPGYRVGWCARPPAARARRPTRCSTGSPTSPGAAAAPGVRRLRSNYARVRPELDAGGAATPSSARGCAPTCATTARRSGCPSWPRTSWSRRSAPRATARCASSWRPAARCVVFLGHLGNWDLAGAWCDHRSSAPVTTVAERLKPEELFEEFLAFRESLGMTIIPLTGGGDVFRELLRGACAAGAFVPLLADRDLTARRRRGRPLRPAGPDGGRAGRAGRWPTGAALHPVVDPLRAAAGRPGGWRHRHRHPLPRPGRRCRRPARPASKVAAMTQACADVLGAAIREHPQDWHMLQRVFVDDLDRAPAGRRGDRAAPREDRHRLPLLLRRPRRGAVPRPRPGRALHRPGPRRSACSRPADDDTAAAALRRRRPGARSRCATTARWPGSPSGR